MLVVEDDPGYGPLILRMLVAGDCEPTLARTADQAMAACGNGESFELAICDLGLPGTDGLELIGQLRREAPEIAIVVATGISDTRTAGAATELGAFGYLIKPFDQNQLLITVENALHRRQLEIGERRRQDELEGMVDERSRQLRLTVSELRESRQETIEKLMLALEMRDGATGAHVERIGQLAEALSGWVGIDRERARSIGLAARMHDIGKIGVPDRVLLKAGSLDPDERREMERHPTIGREILLNSKTELLRLASTIAGTHHERFDDGGYPDGLAGEAIPREGRIAAIADVFDALHSERSYRPPLPAAEALQIVREGRGGQFDPEILDVFLGRYAEAITIIGRG